MSLLISPFKKGLSKWIGVLIVLAGIWIFSLLAGAGPSVMRSAFMFSLIVIGNAFSKRNTIYNNLAASAFLLLCWNPFWLWDIGFQLSYAAVLSIVIFFRPIYGLLYVRNKLLDAIWKLNAVTLAAQLLTVPLSIYHFHQFPNLFLVANLLAVPLSSLLLVGEIILCSASFMPMLAGWIGAALNALLQFLNSFIENINALPFASWTHLNVNIPQLAFLYAFIGAISYWLMYRSKKALFTALCMLGACVMVRTYSFITSARQQKLIVYNVPKHPAIDFIKGRNYYFFGDPIVQADKMLRNFYVEPSRILHRVSWSASLPGFPGDNRIFSFCGKTVLVVSGPLPVHIPEKMQIDVLVLSQNSRIPLNQVLQSSQIAQVVADGSNTNRFTGPWRRQCEALNIPFHSVAEDGAYVLDLR